MENLGLSVLEARWWSEGNDTVRPLFETLGGIIAGNPHSIRYDMFAEEYSLSQIIRDVCEKDFHSIYIGAHGNETAIYGLNSNPITRAKLRNMFLGNTDTKKIKGLFFGSCFIASKGNAEFFLETDKTCLEWVGGYTENVDWVDSSAVDLIFWSKYLRERKKNNARKKQKKNELQMVIDAGDQMKEIMPDVSSVMGFNVYYKCNNDIKSIW